MTNAQGSYRDRSEAGRVLARHVREQIHDAGATVLALPRGGVPVAFEIARVLDAPLDVLVVRKRGVPGQPEPFGAVGQWYRDFAPTTDDEVREILARRDWHAAP